MNNDEQERLLLATLEQTQEQLLTILERLVGFHTESPPARNTNELQLYLKETLEKLDFTVETAPFYRQDTLLWATKEGTDPEHYQSLIWNGHVDVAALESLANWQTNPFELVKKGSRLFGRGVSDMKGSVACVIWLVQTFHQLKIHLPGTLLLQSVVGEEAGEAGTKKLLESGQTADFAIVGDTSDLQFQGQGGVITGWIQLKSPETFHDGNRMKMVHTGGGLFGANMIEKMTILIQALQTLERHWGIMKSYPGFEHGTNTINPAYIEGGIHPAFVPNNCRLWITVHFYPNESIEQVTSEIEAHILATAKADPWMKENLPTFEWGGESMLVDKGEVFPPLALDPTHPAMLELAKSHEAQTASKPTTTMSTSVSDGGWFGAYDIPAVVYGPGELLQAHSDNESIELDQLLTYSKILGIFLLRWLSTKKTV
ncbi:acetylornithine deacetylase [Enterococcus camelliae]|uniref:Acetylornithine deacetylase n=1 Tax=Enterococcus camelliae TaxID=453959 RepID=A0ABW5TGL2_9ENTE